MIILIINEGSAVDYEDWAEENEQEEPIPQIIVSSGDRAA